MDFLGQFVHNFIYYCQELWWILAIGFLLSGIFNEFIPEEAIEEHLGGRGIRSILIASVAGVILPVCCIGSLPIALTFRKKGASLGAVLAFLVATPATSASAIVVCWKLLGFTFTLYAFFAVILMALVMGIIGNQMHAAVPPVPQSSEEEKEPCCCHAQHKTNEKAGWPKRAQKVLTYAYITLPKEIGKEIFLGIALAAFIVACGPLQQFIQHYLTGAIGYIFVLVVGLLTYVCSTASVPMADAFVHSGMSYGQALCYLLVGPITSYGTILVIKKEFGLRILFLYLGVISILSLLFGIAYDIWIL